MPPPTDSSQPRLAAGCRWGNIADDPAILFPEGMIRVQGTGQAILALCDGTRTVAEIGKILTAKYAGVDPAKVRRDVSKFLEDLQARRIIDY